MSQERVKDEMHFGWRQTATVGGHARKIKDFMLENRQLTIEDIDDSVEI